MVTLLRVWAMRMHTDLFRRNLLQKGSSLGKPRKKWRDNIKTHLKEIRETRKRTKLLMGKSVSQKALSSISCRLQCNITRDMKLGV